MEREAELTELVQLWQKSRAFTGEADECKLIDTFISKHRDGKFAKETA